MFKNLIIILFFNTSANAQSCDCKKEFLHVKGLIENNYAGFNDKQSIMTKTEYEKKTAVFESLAANHDYNEQCLLIISQYLDIFKDDHIQVSTSFDAGKQDTAFINQRKFINHPPDKLISLASAKNTEGIYLLNYDSAYKIAVVKEHNTLFDYSGVIVESKLPSWKKGMIKFVAKHVNDSLLKGLLYMRNHLPKVEWFYLGKNSIGGDWQREGTVRNTITNEYVPVSSKKLSDKTFYIRISTFNSANAKRIDSLLKANNDIINNTPNLVLDLRNNGGGSDFSYASLLPLIYSGVVRNIGLDVLSTDVNIAGWKKLLDDENIPEESKRSITVMIQKMESNKGKLVNIVDDEIDSAYKILPFPKRVAILINKGSASTTEQFLLYAMQSSKVTLLGENTQGTLDYSNMREIPFACMPYILRVATTRSRRLDMQQGIDNVGIKPNKYLAPGTDWIEEARKLLEQ